MPRKDMNPDDYPQTPDPVMGDGGLEHQPIEFEHAGSMSEADLAAFMEEKVVIRLHKKKDAKPMELVSPSVNGRIQHLFRGIPQVCARKYLEVLWRSHETSYDYEVEANVAILEGELPKASTSPTHPFEVLQDTPKGRAWLEELSKQPV